MKLKMQQQQLKEANAVYQRQVGAKEHEVKAKGDFVQRAGQELDHRQLAYLRVKLNYEQLDARDKKAAANLRGLINYAKKLTLELETQREKVQMAETIIKDLKQAGSDNINSLMHLLDSYKLREMQCGAEIRKLGQLTALKDNEIAGLDEDIAELQSYLGTAKDKLEARIQEMLRTIEGNKRTIRR